MQNQMTILTSMLTKFMNANTASTSGSGSLPSNTVANPRVERETEVTKDTAPPTNNGSTKDVQPLVVQIQPQVPNSEPVVAHRSASDEPVVAPKTKSTIPYPSRINREKLREKDDLLALKFMEIF
ncbi:hypothetical protein Tco_1290834 [Tanacetum coccineum]